MPNDGRAIVTRRPVSDIVRDALTVEVSRNGHAVLPNAQDVVLAAEVEEFWLDVVVGRSHAQYVGKVVLALAVVDGRNGETLFTRHYAATKRREADADAKDVAREVMDAALARTLHDFAIHRKWSPRSAVALADVTSSLDPNARRRAIVSLGLHLF